MRMAICDDEERAARLLEKAAADALREAGIRAETATYTLGSNLLDDVRDDGAFFDLILLDIEMPGMDGMEMARLLRKSLPNVRIIFVTSHLEYAIDAFELSIFRYVPKSDLETRLAAAVVDAARLIELETGREYTIRTASRLERVPYRDILHIQRDGRNARIVSTFGTAKVRKSLQKVHEELDAPEFVFLDRGCIANILQIMRVSGDVAVLKDGTELPISRGRLAEVKNAICQYWGAHV